ncbi:hypothetical protein [Micromonospora sp. NPDC049102]|uniref:hypothetical protein n=1 Tax=Micromonospora sp. NPDC049102 TaxID=3364265 RepID=UPI00371CD585
MVTSDDKLNSPSYAKLPDGISREGLLEAVLRSGYPLQTAIADTLEKIWERFDSFRLIQEEWAFVDGESGQIRSIDLFAELELPTEVERTAVAPALNLLVECKQSELPYIFFTRPNSPELHYSFPQIAGLKHKEIEFFFEADGELNGASYLMSIHDTFAFWDIEFFGEPAPNALSIAKVLRKAGGKLELTGEEAYRAITLPLVKAADHLAERCAPTAETEFFQCRFIICLAVLRAPMFSVMRANGADHLVPTRWVRGCRLEPPTESMHPASSSTVRHFDMIHEDFLPEYMEKLIESVKIVGERIASQGAVVASGRAIEGHREADGESWIDMRAVDRNVERSPEQLAHRAKITRTRSRFVFSLDEPSELTD